MQARGGQLGYVPVVIADVCGAGYEQEAARSLDLLRFAGNAILGDVKTISCLLWRSSNESVSGRDPLFNKLPRNLGVRSETSRLVTPSAPAWSTRRVAS